MSGWVEDRWVRDGRRTAQYGTGMRYRARWTDADGRERAKSFPDRHKEDATNYAQAAAVDVLRGTWEDRSRGRVSLRRFTEDTWLPAQAGAHSTQIRIASQLKNHVYPQLGSRTLAELARSPSVISAWVRNMHQAESTKQIIFGLLSSILAAAVDDELIGRNPCKVKTVGRPDPDDHDVVPWAPETVARIRSELDARWKAVVDCGAGLGLRQGEMLGLSADAIDWLKREVRVIRQLRTVQGHLILSLPKGRKTRTVPLPGSVSLALAAHIAAFPAVTVRLPWDEIGGELTEVSLLFTTPSGRPARASDWNDGQWKPAVKRAGLPGARDDGFHRLRHTYASVLLSDGEDIVRVSRYLGHAKVSTTLDIYAHIVEGRADRTRKIIDSRTVADSDRTGDLEGGSGAGQA